MTVYVSSRGIPLLCQAGSERNRPIVTLENYEKWYAIQILHPCGRVEEVKTELIDKICDKLRRYLFVDHNVHPRLLNEVANHIGGTADWRALEMAGGRWVNEIMDGELPGWPSFNLPPTEEE